MATKKRQPASTAAAYIDAFIDAAKGPLRPPEHVTLRPQDEPYWDIIVGGRARADWTQAQLVVAAQLARAQADISEWQDKLDDEGPTTVDRFGQDKANPLVNIIEAATRRQLALMRSLGMAASSDEAQIQAKRDAAHKGAKQAREQVEGEGLLAT
jgi:hypothetical protein